MMVGASGIGVIFQMLFCLVVIKGSSSAVTIHNQKECSNTNAVLDCPHFTENKHGKLHWRYFDKSTSQWMEIASIKHGHSRLSSANTALDGQLAIHSNGSLQISSLKPEDETEYQCIVKQGPRKLHVIKLSVSCGIVTRIEREVCVEEHVVLECAAKHRANSRKLAQVKWHKKLNVSEGATWFLLVASDNESAGTKTSGGFKLHGNGSLLLPRGREESEDTYKCVATKKGNGGLDKHIIVVKNIKCRQEKPHTVSPTMKTTAGRVAMTTATPIKGTKVVMDTSSPPSVEQTTANTASTDLVTSANIKTTKGRVAMTTATPVIKRNEVAMETSTLSPGKQTTVQATSTSSSSIPQNDRVTSSTPTTESVVCGGILRDSVGTFQSPDFPSSYPANSHCKWTISVPQGYAAIDITLDHLRLEHDDHCGSDYIKILDELGNQVGCRQCGVHDSSVKIQVRGRVAIVVFRSDSSVQKEGFKLNYKAVKTAAETDLQ